jgi:hypothetical protein
LKCKEQKESNSVRRIRRIEESFRGSPAIYYLSFRWHVQVQGVGAIWFMGVKGQHRPPFDVIGQGDIFLEAASKQIYLKVSWRHQGR